MPKVTIKVTDTKVRQGEKFLKIAVSGRERWVSERGYSEMKKMVRRGASAMQIRKSMQSYTEKKTLGYTEKIISKDDLGLTNITYKKHIGKKQLMIENLDKAFDKTDVPEDLRKAIKKELESMTEKEIADFFDKKSNQKYLDNAFRYEETDDEGHTTALDDPQISNEELRQMLGKKNKSATSLLFKLQNRKMM